MSAVAAVGGQGVGSSVRGVGQGELRLTVRGRVVLVLLVAVVVATAALWGGRAVASGPGRPLEVTVHVVGAGETLWDHASVLAGDSRDVRDVVSELMELNNLSSSGLQVGQRLLLPAERLS